MSGSEASPLFSVVLPVYNGKATLERALGSIQAQTFRDWEVVAVDDGSSDGSYEVLEEWAARDGRVRAARLEENRGVSAARNAAVRLARGRMVTYLDRDDEYCADYLEQLARRWEDAEVLVCGYDVIYDGGTANGLRESWDPRRVHQDLLAENITTPLGVSHRRGLCESVGGFNELMWFEEDWDLWKRMARAGARFLFLPVKSGCFHVRPDSASRKPRPTRRQREMVAANWEAGRAVFSREGGEAERGSVRRIACVSTHCLLDTGSAAAAGMTRTMEFLGTLGFECAAFCGGPLGAGETPAPQGGQEAAGGRAAPQETPASEGARAARLISTRWGAMSVTIFRSASTRGQWLNQAEVGALLQAFTAFLDQHQPEAVLTFGSDEVSRALIKLAKRRDIPIVFAAYDFSCREPGVFKGADYVIVPSESLRRHYWNNLGVACHMLPPVVDAGQALEPDDKRANEAASGGAGGIEAEPSPRPSPGGRGGQEGRLGTCPTVGPGDGKLETCPTEGTTRLAHVYRDFFSGLCPQPSAPIVPVEGKRNSSEETLSPGGRGAAEGLEQPLISVILPVYNGEATLDRALRSLQAQTFSNWELVAVDDGSTDDSRAILERWAAEDSRIRIIRSEENRGPSAARNAGLREARGEFVAYLDHDDEFYPDYLQQVARRSDQAELLMFAYDVVQEDGQSGEVLTPWDPGAVRRELFFSHIAMPMAVSHRRRHAQRLGGFNELLWWEEDAEFWRRLVRGGATLACVPQKSGRYYVRAGSRRRAPRMTREQKEILEANWRAGRGLYEPQLQGPKPQVARRKSQIRRIAFVSPYSVIDYSSGAAIATANALRLLRQIGFECEAFCGSYLDVPEEGVLEEMLTRQNNPYEVRGVKIGDYEGRMIFAYQGPIPVTIFRTASTMGQWRDEAEVNAFLQTYAAFLDKSRPDAVWTYGGDMVATAMVQAARDRDIPVVFGLHNFAYNDPEAFAAVDYVTVPSEFSRQYYWSLLGLACHTLPCVVNWERVQVSDRAPRYVTLVNPQIPKGLSVFARIAAELTRRRPDIKLMVVEGRSHAGWRRETGVDLSRLPNVNVMSSMGDPRSFYALARLLLMPSLCYESFGLVAAEAMLNGIPVLASNRGALPETVGRGGFLFDIPPCYTPQSHILPTAEEVEPWVETIIRLWDDGEFYQQASDAAKQHAERWRQERLALIYRDFFGSVCLQPGPPLIPKVADGGHHRAGRDI